MSESARLLEWYRRASVFDIWVLGCAGVSWWYWQLKLSGMKAPRPWRTAIDALNGTILMALLVSHLWQRWIIRKLEATPDALAVGPIAHALVGETSISGAAMILAAPVGGARNKRITNKRQRARLISRMAAILPDLSARQADLLPDSHLDALVSLAVTASPNEHLQFVLETLRLFHRIEDPRIMHAMEGMATALPLSANVIQVRDLARELLPDMRRFASRHPDAARLVRASANPADPAATLVRPAQPGGGDTGNLVRAAGYAEEVQRVVDRRADAREDPQRVG